MDGAGVPQVMQPGLVARAVGAPNAGLLAEDTEGCAEHILPDLSTRLRVVKNNPSFPDPRACACPAKAPPRCGARGTRRVLPNLARRIVSRSCFTSTSVRSRSR